MNYRIILPGFLWLFLTQGNASAQQADSIFTLSAIIYDEQYLPVSAAHVVNMNSHQGDVTDSLGIFSLPVRITDTLLVRNIVYRDTLVTVDQVRKGGHIRLRPMVYPLDEAKVFVWGSSYDDFQEAFIGMPMQQSLGSSLGLPRQDPGKVPLEMDEKAVKSLGHLLSSPVSFFYQNFNRHAKSARKVYWLEQNKEEKDKWEALTGPENLAEISGFGGDELIRFRRFLLQRILCDMKCSELEVLNEIYGLLDFYRDLRNAGMLED